MKSLLPIILALLTCANATGETVKIVISEESNIEEWTASISNEDHKALLVGFIRSHASEGDRVSIVSEDENNYELIVEHPSENRGFTGGAEQYFLNKGTGDIQMGWHEHPMKIPEFD